MFKFQNQNGKKKKKISGLQNVAIRDYKLGQVLRITDGATEITNRGSFKDFKLGQKDYKSGQRNFKSGQRDLKSEQRLQIRARGISNQDRDYK